MLLDIIIIKFYKNYQNIIILMLWPHFLSFITPFLTKGRGLRAPYDPLDMLLCPPNVARATAICF